MARDIEAVRAARRRWYYKNQEEQKAKALQRKKDLIQRNQEFVRDLKTAPCTDCGISYPYYVMEFDHLGLEEKLDCVSALIRKPASIEILQAEIDKCELVCSNCHRVRTFARLNP